MKSLAEMNEELERVRMGLAEVGREFGKVVKEYRTAEAVEKISLAVYIKAHLVGLPKWQVEYDATVACKAEILSRAKLQGDYEALKARKDIGMGIKDTVVMESSTVKAIDLELLKSGAYGA